MSNWIKQIVGIAVLGLNRNRILEKVHADPQSAWPVVERVWRAARGVYRSPIGASARVPFELLLLEEMLKKPAECEDVLAQHISHSNAYVSAYCLLGLERLGSHKIKDLPESLTSRQETVRICIACLSMPQSLGSFAKQLSAVN